MDQLVIKCRYCGETYTEDKPNARQWLNTQILNPHAYVDVHACAEGVNGLADVIGFLEDVDVGTTDAEATTSTPVTPVTLTDDDVGVKNAGPQINVPTGMSLDVPEDLR